MARPVLATDHRWRGHHGIARSGANVLPFADGRLDSLPLKSARGPSVVSAAGLHLMRQGVRHFYSPGFQPLWPPAPNLRQYLTIHDLIHLDDALESSTAKRQYFSRVVFPAVRSAGLVFTVSEYSRRRILDRLGNEIRVVVTVAASSLVAPPAPSCAENPGRGADPYVLYVGNFKPHKNFHLLTEAMNQLDGSIRLVCVGTPTEHLGLTEIQQRRTTFVRGVDDEVLALLYAGAAAVAVPSTIEGF